MSRKEKQAKAQSSLLWDCFTNWSLTLEKTTGTEMAAKRKTATLKRSVKCP